jgi:hypothetical protein
MSFDPEPALAIHGRDRPPKGHWQPVKWGSKMDEYFRLFSLKSRELWVFWHDGEGFFRKNGILS